MVAHVFNSRAQEGGRGRFEVSLVYVGSFKSAKIT